MAKIFDEIKEVEEWLVELCQAIDHDAEEYVPILKIRDNFAELGLRFNGEKISSLSPEGRYAFEEALGRMLAVFTHWKYLYAESRFLERGPRRTVALKELHYAPSEQVRRLLKAQKWLRQLTLFRKIQLNYITQRLWPKIRVPITVFGIVFSTARIVFQIADSKAAIIAIITAGVAAMVSTLS